MMEENGRSLVYFGVHWLFDAFVEKVGRNIGVVGLGFESETQPVLS